jgi:predicted nicotinamide N-methyase
MSGVVAQNRCVSRDLTAFVRAHLRAEPVAFVPELSLYQAEEPIGLWQLTEGEYHSDQPPPFWAFAWAGGQGLARYVVDHPEEVSGKAVLDLASGSGLVAIAAARAGAASVRAVEIEPMAAAAISLNSSLNGVRVDVTVADVLDQRVTDATVVLAGDVFYSKAMAGRVLTYLRRAARNGVEVLVGDPGRAYFPGEYFSAVSTYEVPVRYELESTNIRTVAVWRINPRGAARKPEGTGFQSTEHPRTGLPALAGLPFIGE